MVSAFRQLDYTASKLFKDCNGIVLSPTQTVYYTSGHTKDGIGSGRYIFDPNFNDVEGRTNLLPTSDDITGNGWYQYTASEIVRSFNGTYTSLMDNNPSGYPAWTYKYSSVNGSTVFTGEALFKKTISNADSNDDPDNSTNTDPQIINPLLRLRWLGAGGTNYVSILFDTATGNFRNGSKSGAGGVSAYDYKVVDAGDDWRVVLTAKIPDGSTDILFQIYPSNSINWYSSPVPTGTVLVRGTRLYRGVSDLFVVDNTSTFTDSLNRVFVLSPDQTITPYMFGVIDNGTDDYTVNLQRYFNYVTTKNCGVTDFTCSVALTAPLKWGTSKATLNFIGNLRLSADVPMDYMLYISNQDLVTVNGRISVSGYGDTDWTKRGCRFGVKFNECGRMNFSGGGIISNNFTFAGVHAADGNNNYLNLGYVKGFYCGSGSTSDGRAYSLSGQWTNPVQDAQSDQADQVTTIDVTCIPPELILSVPGNAQVDLGTGRPHLLYGYTRTDGSDPTTVTGGKIKVYPWVDLRTIQSGTITWIFGGLVSNGGGNGNEMTGTIDAQLCGRALSTYSLFGGQFQISAQNCGQLACCGTRRYGVHQPDTFTLVYSEACTHNITIANTVSGDFGRVKVLAQHAETRASKDWGFFPIHIGNSTTYQSSDYAGLVDSSFVYQHRIVNYEKGDPRNYKKISDDLNIDPNRNSVWIEEVNITSRSVNIGSLNTGIRRNLGISGGRYVARGTGPNGAPTGTITFKASDGLASGASSQAFSNFDGPAVFSFEYDSLTAGFFVHLLSGKGPVPTTVPYAGATIPANSVTAIATATVTNAALGDFIDSSLSTDMKGAGINAWVSSANTVSYMFRNLTSSSITLPAATLRFRLRKA